MSYELRAIYEGRNDYDLIKQLDYFKSDVFSLGIVLLNFVT